MRLTIIRDDKYVSVDKVGYSGLQWTDTPVNVHALQWFENTGWIEYSNDELPNLIINELPQWSINAKEAWQIHKDKPAPLSPTIEENAAKVDALLQETSWTCEDNQGVQSADSYTLQNKQEFLDFRAELETLLSSIHAGPIDFPITPESVWLPPNS
tara:strand:+ start:16473 stop:16940 length:468 start_codon:yes stop_codon:yes gene_type:complete